jgi:hypothetical protein
VPPAIDKFQIPLSSSWSSSCFRSVSRSIGTSKGMDFSIKWKWPAEPSSLDSSASSWISDAPCGNPALPPSPRHVPGSAISSTFLFHRVVQIVWEVLKELCDSDLRAVRKCTEKILVTHANIHTIFNCYNYSCNIQWQYCNETRLTMQFTRRSSSSL